MEGITKLLKNLSKLGELVENSDEYKDIKNSLNIELICMGLVVIPEYVRIF